MTRQQIEKAAQQHADSLRVPSAIPGVLVPMLHDIAKDSYKQGAQDAISSQWVSVGDALPEDDNLVLAHFADVDSPLEYATAYYRNGVWNIPDDWYYDCRIDFWMPITAIPQLNPEKE